MEITEQMRNAVGSTSYRNRINNSIDNVYQTSVANDILQYMGKVRNESDFTQARRWVMELLQNARDIACKEDGKTVPVKIQIELTDEQLLFRHTGKVFSVQDILSIVHQVSSKKPGEGIGKFGTGFMSTYQLSEVIELSSYLHEPGLMYCPFRIRLDRTGQTKEEILEAIRRNLDELREIDSANGIREERFCRDNYNTEFIYRLDCERNRKIAQTGVDDLADSILYIMLFSDKISCVEILYRTRERNETVRYQRGECEPTKWEGIKKLTVFENARKHQMISYESEFLEDTLTIACEYGENGFLPIPEKTPRVFIDFPLVGAEQFPFPIVFNHRKLKSNEPRSGITLVEHENSLDSKLNQQIVDRAVFMYGEMMSTIGYEAGIENILSIPERTLNKEWSEEWVKTHIYETLYRKISNIPFLLVGQERVRPDEENMKLLKADTAEDREKLCQLLEPVRGIITPTDSVDWYQTLEGYELTDSKWLELKDVLDHISQFLDKIEGGESAVLSWCNLLYRMGMENPEIAMEINSGTRAVFVSQSEQDWKEKKLYTISEISVDPDIPEILKDVAEELDGLGTVQCELPFAIRTKLLHKDFQVGENSRIRTFEPMQLENYIVKRSSRQTKVTNFIMNRDKYLNHWQNAWKLLVSCGPSETMYRLYSKIWSRDCCERCELKDERFSRELWKGTYRSVLESIMDRIQEFTRVSDFYLKHNLEEEEGVECLNLCYQEVVRYFNLHELKYKRLIPVQNGTFGYAYQLYLDGVQSELKEITEAFSDEDENCKLSDYLVDSKFKLEQWSMMTKEDQNVAGMINNVIQRILAQQSLSEVKLGYQEACTRLLGWIEDNGELAEKYFPSFWREEDRMKLLTPKAAARINKKAKILNRLMEKIGSEDCEECESVEMLMHLLEIGKQVQDGQLPDGEDMHDDSAYYDPELDVFFGDDLWELGEMERQRILRMIGNAGEEYAYQLVKNQFVGTGYEMESETAHETVLIKAEGNVVKRVVIQKPDTESYHQSGWDIKVIHEDGQEEYYEVKTHTTTSRVKNQLHISNEQMKLAAQMRERYIIIMPYYDRMQEAVIGHSSYPDPIAQLGAGTLRNLSDGFLWGIA